MVLCIIVAELDKELPQHLIWTALDVALEYWSDCSMTALVMLSNATLLILMADILASRDRARDLSIRARLVRKQRFHSRTQS